MNCLLREIIRNPHQFTIRFLHIFASWALLGLPTGFFHMYVARIGFGPNFATIARNKNNRVGVLADCDSF